MSGPDLPRRLAELRAEYTRGEQMLAQLEREARELRERLLRIDGAIKVLEELSPEEAGESDR